MRIVGLETTEAQLQRAVIDLANVRGWLTAHFHDSRRQVTRRGVVSFIGDAAASGFPDLPMIRPPRVIFAELKSEKGRLRPAQRRWLDTLGQCPGVETYVWRPSDWDEIERALR